MSFCYQIRNRMTATKWSTMGTHRSHNSVGSPSTVLSYSYAQVITVFFIGLSCGGQRKRVKQVLTVSRCLPLALSSFLSLVCLLSPVNVISRSSYGDLPMSPLYPLAVTSTLTL